MFEEVKWVVPFWKGYWSLVLVTSLLGWKGDNMHPAFSWDACENNLWRSRWQPCNSPILHKFGMIVGDLMDKARWFVIKQKLHFLPSWSFLTLTFPDGAKQPQDTEHKAAIFNSACENKWLLHIHRTLTCFSNLSSQQKRKPPSLKEWKVCC